MSEAYGWKLRSSLVAEQMDPKASTEVLGKSKRKPKPNPQSAVSEVSSKSRRACSTFSCHSSVAKGAYALRAGNP